MEKFYIQHNMKKVIGIWIFVMLCGLISAQTSNTFKYVIKTNGGIINTKKGLTGDRVDSTKVASDVIKFYQGATELTPSIPAGGQIDGATVYIKQLQDTIFDATTVDTLKLTYASRMVRYNNVAKTKVYIPTDAAVAFPLGTIINIKMDGTGIVGILGCSGVVVQSELDSCYINNRHGWATVIKRASNKWDLLGSLLN
jgi:hypothetical protein